MKYRELWALCENCFERFQNLPSTAVITIDEHIELTIEEFNAKVGKDIERQQTLQASSTKQKKADAATIEAQWKEKHLAAVLQMDEVIFLRETVSGVFNNKEMLDLAFDAYRSGMKRNRQDHLALIFVTYLLLFRYEELGGPTFRLLIDRCAPYPKLAEYMEFLLNRTSLDNFVVPKWRTTFDDTYTEEVLVGSLLAIKEDVEDNVLSWLKEKGTNIAAAKEKREAALASLQAKSSPTSPGTRKVLVQSPGGGGGEAPTAFGSPSTARTAKTKVHFNRKGEMIPPLEVREMLTMEPLPKLPRVADRASTPELEAVRAAKNGEKRSTLRQEVRDENRRKEQEQPFRSFSATARPTNLPKLLQEQKEREEAAMRPVFANRPGPEQVRRKLESINDNVEVRVTNAALLREELLYAKRAEEEDLALKRKMKDLRDDSEFMAWKRKGEAEDEIRRQDEIAQRKLEMMMVDAEARAAKERQTKKNLAASRHFRQKAEVEKRKQAKENAKKEKQLADNAKQIRIEAEAAAKVKDKVAETNAKIGREMLLRKQEDEMKIATALELERERKQELIRRIKEVHAQSVEVAKQQRERKRHVKPVDLGELVAMTYDQLQEALVTVNAEHEALVAARREKIIATREKEKVQRSEVEERILMERQRHRDRKAAEREQKRAEEAVKAEKLRQLEEQRLLDLQSKLQTKREDRAQVLNARKDEDRQRRLAAQLLSADANAVERQKWDDMYRAAQNTIVKAQNERLANNRVNRKRDATVTNLRETNIDTAHRSRMETLHQKDVTFSQRREESQRNMDHDEAVRVEAYRRMKAEKEKRKELMTRLP